MGAVFMSLLIAARGFFLFVVLSRNTSDIDPSRRLAGYYISFAIPVVVVLCIACQVTLLAAGPVRWRYANWTFLGPALALALVEFASVVVWFVVG